MISMSKCTRYVLRNVNSLAFLPELCFLRPSPGSHPNPAVLDQAVSSFWLQMTETSIPTSLRKKKGVVIMA